MTNARTRAQAVIENITVTTGDGRIFDLGSPHSRFFRMRVIIYRLRRKLNG